MKPLKLYQLTYFIDEKFPFLLLASLFFFLICNVGVAHSQKWQTEFFVGGSAYNGDLTEDITREIWNDFHISGGAGIRYKLIQRMDITLRYHRLLLRSDDFNAESDFRMRRNLQFRTTVNEATLNISYKIFAGEKLSWHLTGGGGLLHFTPRAPLNGFYYELRPLGTEGQGTELNPDDQYPEVTAVLLGGGRIEFQIDHRISTFLMGHLRYAFTDYIDDVSGIYVDNQELRRIRGPVSAMLADPTTDENFPAGSRRGTPANNDLYGFIGVGIGYNLREQ